MCDYSLNTFPNRLAQDGEELVLHRFPSGCMGFVSAEDFLTNHVRRIGRGSGLAAWFFPRRHNGPAAVCVPHGSTLVFEGMPSLLRGQLGLAATEEALLVPLSEDDFYYRDGLRFANGERILLQRFPEGQRAVVRLKARAFGTTQVPESEEIYA